MSAGVSLALVAIILSFTLFSANKTKISGIGIFGDPTIVHTKIELVRLSHANPSALFSRLLHNKPIYALSTITQNYLKSYSPEFLFITGGKNHAHNIQGYGNMHPIESIFLLLGLCFVLTQIKRKNIYSSFGGYLQLESLQQLPKDAPHSNRMFAVVPALSILVALGIQQAQTFIQGNKKLLFSVIVGFLYAWSLLVYKDAYFIHFPYEEAQYWGSSYKQLSVIVNKPEYKDKNIIISTPQESPYIYMLFMETMFQRFIKNRRYDIQSLPTDLPM